MTLTLAWLTPVLWGAGGTVESTASSADEASSRKDIDIRCDGPVIYLATNATVIFTNNVRATDTESTLTCDQLTMELEEGTGPDSVLGAESDSENAAAPKDPLRRIIAEGHVVIKNAKGQVTGNKAVYDAHENTLTLTGETKTIWKGAEITSPRIVFNQLTGRISYDPPFHFEGTALKAIFSMPGTRSGNSAK